MNGLIIRSPYVRLFASEIVRFVSGVPSRVAATRACPEDGSNRFWVDEKFTVIPGSPLGLPVTVVPVALEFNRMFTSPDGLLPGVKIIEACKASGDYNAKT
jgi:hypothetical protein